MKYILILILNLLFVFHLQIFSKSYEFISYTFGDEIYVMLDDGNYLWLGTDGGLVKFNKVTNEKIFFNKANTNNGLMDNHIRALALDSNKNLWIGTYYGGLSKFDGSNWQNYNPNNSPLISETVSCLSVDIDNKVFIGNGIHLSIFDGINWSSYKLGKETLSFFKINSASFDSKNQCWIATEESGSSRMFVYKDNLVSLIDNDTTRSITSLIVDKDDIIWCGSSNLGLVKYNGIYFENFDTSNSNIPTNNISIVNIDYNGNLWCNNDTVVWKYDKKNWTSYGPNIPLSNFYYSSAPGIIIFDSSKILWIATFGAGLLKYENNIWEDYNCSNSGLITNFSNLIATDEDGKVWITFYQPRDSVLCFDGNNWVFYKRTDFDFWNKNFQQICDDDTVQIWIGKGILIEFVQTEYNWVGVYNINKHRHGTNIKIDQNKNVWQTSAKRGLLKYDHQNWTTYNYENTSINFKETYDIAFDDNNNLYAISDVGLVKYNGKEWILYPKKVLLDEAQSYEISALETDSDGNIWMGCNNYSLQNSIIKFDGIDVIRYEIDNCNSTITDIIFDSQNYLWIGTESSGLFKFNCRDTSWVYIAENSGIFSRFSITPLEIDIHDNIWMNCWWGGIGVFNEKGVITTVTKNKNISPNEFKLFYNYPNPFNPTTTISYQIPEQGFVILKVYDMLGREVASLVNNKMEAGKYTVNFNAGNLASGVYIYRLNVQSFEGRKSLCSKTEKMILLK